MQRDRIFTMWRRLSPEMAFYINAVIVFVVVWAAARFLKGRQTSQFREDLWGPSGKRSPANEEQIHRTLDYIALDAPEGGEEITEKVRKHATRQEAAPYHPPNFKGKPHEILGIAADADRETVLAAYKYWIKRYHPDRVQHLGPGYIKQANQRAEQLNEAKTILLKRWE